MPLFSSVSANCQAERENPRKQGATNLEIYATKQGRVHWPKMDLQPFEKTP